MGSFDIKCSISGYPILEGTKVVLIPITQKRFSSKLTQNGYEDTLLVYTNEIFKFMGLGIKGTYNGYDSLEDIEKDFYYDYYKSLLMEECEKDIDETEFLERLNNNQTINHFYIKREIYDFLISTHINEDKYKQDLINIYLIFKQSFIKLKEFNDLEKDNFNFSNDDKLFREYLNLKSINSVYRTLQNDLFYLDNNLKLSLHFDFSYYSLNDSFLSVLKNLSEKEFVDTLFKLINFKYIIESLCIPIIPSIVVSQGENHLIINYMNEIHNIIKKCDF